MKLDGKRGFPFTTPNAGTKDGRNLDATRGVLTGEAAQQKVKHSSPRAPRAGMKPEVARRSGEATLAPPLTPTYYGQPLLHEPVWTWMIPSYFYLGGVGGAAGVVGAAAQLVGGRAMRPLVELARLVAAGTITVGAGLLVLDLGKPLRFLHMLRVLRLSSPMSVGSWVLSGAGASSALAALASLVGKRGRLRAARSTVTRVGDGAGLALGLFGVPLTGYTAVLLSSTAVPVWQNGRRSLPPLFMSSALASFSSLVAALPIALPPASERALSIAGAAAKAAEIVALERYVGDARFVQEVGRALDEGRPHLLLTIARTATLASLALDALTWLLPRRRALPPQGHALAHGVLRRRRPLGATLHPLRTSVHRAAGVLGTVAGVILRFAVTSAGRSSTENPRATIANQTARRGTVASERSVAKTTPSDASPLPQVV